MTSGEHEHTEYALATDVAELTKRVIALENATPEPEPEPEPEPIPSKGRAKLTLGFYPGNFGMNPLANLDRYEKEIGRTVKFVIGNLGKTTWKDLTGSSAVHFGANGWKNRPDVTPCITLPLCTDEDPGPVPADLLATANGRHDADYRLIAQRAVDAGCGDMIWRPGHEADGINSYPWRFNNTNAHKEYIAAFRHVVAVMRSVSADFRFDYQGAGQWEKLNANTGKPNAETGYPGDDFVDFIGLDKYNRTVYQPWDKMVVALDYNLAFARSRGKQSSNPEWGLWIKETGDDPTYIHHFADWLEKVPAIGPGSLAYHGYFWAHAEANLDNAPKSKAAFLERFGS